MNNLIIFRNTNYIKGGDIMSQYNRNKNNKSNADKNRNTNNRNKGNNQIKSTNDQG
ncbi:hypothetical protein [Caproiciproducens sp. MSJ-32]|uniref:hypothetical protein n=1 Tax=Caproiciproducens sp. MSJ-32 TaxID=2841527 RepID=UPI001C114F99|nr:hypothetical protein [Caproiciproducens sp. MSJ-32]MBU5455670.1 hypothetical protein [Caproiciproducens sp. MSJ-32]